VLRRRLRRSRKGAPRVLLIIENISIARDHRAQKQLKSLLAGGYRVGLICRKDENNARFRESGLDLYEYPAPPEGDGAAAVAFEYGYSVLAAVVLVLRALADGPVHAIQVGQPPDVYFVPAFLGKLFGTRFIVDQRDLSPEVFEARFGKSNGVLPRTLRLFERASWRTADHVFTVNGSLVGVVTERGGVSPKHVTAVMNGPLLSAVARGNADEELREGFAHLVCWHGVMGPQDHVEHALQAISHFTHHLGRRDALFVFMGDGVAETGLRQTASHLSRSTCTRLACSQAKLPGTSRPAMPRRWLVRSHGSSTRPTSGAGWVTSGASGSSSNSHGTGRKSATSRSSGGSWTESAVAQPKPRYAPSRNVLSANLPEATHPARWLEVDY
jgi:hypothetical protein